MLYHDHGLRNVRVGLFCETYPDLRDRQISKIKVEFPLWIGRLTNTDAHGLAFILNDELGGGIIALRNLDDPTKYQSAEFAAIFVDELTKTSKATFDVLRGSLRWPGVSHTIFVGATNPGSVGHLWVKSLWIDRVFPAEMESLRDEFIFIQSLPSDNSYLDATYWSDLNTLPDNLRKAWVLGQWDVFEGQAFTSWGPQHVIDTYDIPAYWPRLFGLDGGFAKPMCALWGAQNPSTNQIVIYREMYATQLTDEEQARAVKAHSEGEYIRFFFADPALWIRSTKSRLTLKSTADVFNQHGVYLTPGDNSRISGKYKVDRVLATTQYGEPGLVVMKNCTNLIRTLPALPYSKTKFEDVDTNAEDHAYDALRYLLSATKGMSVPDNVIEDRGRQAAHPLLAIKRRNKRWR